MDYYYFADQPMWNNSPDYLYNKKLSGLCLIFEKKRRLIALMDKKNENLSLMNLKNQTG